MYSLVFFEQKERKEAVRDSLSLEQKKGEMEISSFGE